MKKALLVLPVIAAAIAFGGPVSSSGAEEVPGVGKCPDHYFPVLAPGIEDDRNQNGVVCLKFPDDRVEPIIHDDPQGQPYQCNGTDALTNPDCPEPTDIVDDITE
jgi:hypothetical protein